MKLQAIYRTQSFPGILPRKLEHHETLNEVLFNQMVPEYIQEFTYTRDHEGSPRRVTSRNRPTKKLQMN